MARQPEAPVPAAGTDLTARDVFRPPPHLDQVPDYDRGWVMDEACRAPFLSYLGEPAAVNWSDELELLHEEASRTHFLDRWTRAAIIEGLGRLPRTGRIVDVGCSTGYLLEDLQAAYPEAELVGIDMIGEGLRKAHRSVPRARLLLADACSLPLSEGCVDAVVSANLLEHVPDDRAALREFVRVLRPGAPAAIVVPAGPRTYDYYDRFLGHERRYGRGELAGKCTEAGLEVVADGHLASLLYPPFWVVKQRNRRRRSQLSGDALVAQVSADIGRTHGSRAGELTWRIERLLWRAGVRLPFGIRSFVVARRPGGST